MELLGLSITKAIKHRPETVSVTCYGCARTYVVGVSQVRVYNYCNACKYPCLVKEVIMAIMPLNIGKEQPACGCGSCGCGADESSQPTKEETYQVITEL